MDNTSKKSGTSMKIFKNNKKKSTSLDKSDVTSPSSSSSAEHEANNIDAIIGELDTISIHSDQQIPSTSYYRSRVSVNPNGEGSYGEIFEKVGATIELHVLQDNHPNKKLFDEVRNILICSKLLDKIPEHVDQQCNLVDSHMEIERNHWNKVNEIMMPSTLKRSKNATLEHQSCVERINNDNEIIQKYSRGQQKLIDRSLSILWCKISREYALTCKHLLICIAYNMDYFLPDNNDKDLTEVYMKTDQLYQLIEMSMKNSQASIDIQMKQQNSYQALIKKRKQLKKKVQKKSASIKEIINKVEPRTVDKLKQVVEKYILEAIC
ncbi:GSCOCG00001992001-RA-CDS [Cotesia congregata]|nr:GSCOCG00001992001-RA-CDS [Cotesia congregata]